MKTVVLTQGQVALVDDADFELLNQWKWCAVWCDSTHSFYAARKSEIQPNGKRQFIQMHRQIMGLVVGEKPQVDHIESGQTLDNRRSNLRIATQRQNSCNSRLYANNKSGFKGVTFIPKLKKWSGHIRRAGKLVHLGYFTTPEAAHAAYGEAALKYHGEFARMN